MLPLPTTEEWGEDRGEGYLYKNAPPLPGPLLHPMEERECLVAASPHCAVSQYCILRDGGKAERLGTFPRSAECNSAIQQIENLRYAFAGRKIHGVHHPHAGPSYETSGLT